MPYLRSSMDDFLEVANESAFKKKTVDELLAKAEKTLKFRLKTVGDCDDYLSIVKSEGAKFNECIRTLQKIKKKYDAGKLDKRDYRDQLRAAMSLLRTSCSKLKTSLGNVSNDPANITKEDLVNFNKYITGLRKIVNKRRKEIIAAAKESFDGDIYEEVFTSALEDAFSLDDLGGDDDDEDDDKKDKKKKKKSDDSEADFKGESLDEVDDDTDDDEDDDDDKDDKKDKKKKSKKDKDKDDDDDSDADDDLDSDDDDSSDDDEDDSEDDKKKKKTSKKKKDDDKDDDEEDDSEDEDEDDSDDDDSDKDSKKKSKKKKVDDDDEDDEDAKESYMNLFSDEVKEAAALLALKNPELTYMEALEMADDINDSTTYSSDESEMMDMVDYLMANEGMSMSKAMKFAATHFESDNAE